MEHDEGNPEPLKPSNKPWRLRKARQFQDRAWPALHRSRVFNRTAPIIPIPLQLQDDKATMGAECMFGRLRMPVIYDVLQCGPRTAIKIGASSGPACVTSSGLLKRACHVPVYAGGCASCRKRMRNSAASCHLCPCAQKRTPRQTLYEGGRICGCWALP